MRKEFQNWLSEQFPWIKEAVRRLSSKGFLDDADYQNLLQLVLLDEKPAINASEGELSDSTPAEPGADVKLLSIGETTGIASLRSNVPLEFKPEGLTVIYGLNGAGKSGYVRLIKVFAGLEAPTKLLPDVYSKESPPMSCRIQYSIDGEEKECRWSPSDESVGALQAIDVFDESSIRLYVDSSKEPAFAPRELQILDQLAQASRILSPMIDKQIIASARPRPNMDLGFKDTRAFQWYGGISSRTKIAEIDAYSSWSDSEENRLESLKSIVGVSDPAQELKVLNRQATLIDEIIAQLQNAENKLSEKGVESLQDKVKSANSAKTSFLRSREAINGSALLPGVGEAAWNALWRAAREFSLQHAYPSESFPVTGAGAKCVLCHQEIGRDAGSRLEQFEKFVSGYLAEEVAKAESDLAEAVASLPSVRNPDFLEKILEFGGLSEAQCERLQACWERIVDFVNAISQGSSTKLDGDVWMEIPSLVEHRATMTGRISLLNGAIASGDFAKIKAEILELEARKWLYSVRKTILDYKAGLDEKARLEENRRQVDTTRISRFASQLSDQLLTAEYEERFRAECNALGASFIPVKVQKVGAKFGRVSHTIKLDAVRPEKALSVLSEGEGRIVSLAAFLADVTGRPGKASFVFDDPISSLDDVYVDRVVDRLVLLSSDRQVIVFTHRLSLWVALEEAMDKAGRKGGLTQLSLVSISGVGSGVVDLESSAKIKIVSALNKIKAERIPRAVKSGGQGMVGAYESELKSICLDLRILTERIIEEVLLDSVVRRYRRSIITKGKLKRLARIEEADCDMLERMMTRYSVFVHSQPVETGYSLPTVEQVLRDVDELLTWQNEFQKSASG